MANPEAVILLLRWAGGSAEEPSVEQGAPSEENASSSAVVAGGGGARPFTAEQFECRVEAMADGRLVGSFVVARAGPYEMRGWLHGEPMRCGPLRLRVRPGPFSLPRCEAVGDGALFGVAGDEAQFQIRANDKSGNLVGEGGERWRVQFAYDGEEQMQHGSLAPVAPVVHDGGDGSYTVAYTACRAGAAMLRVWHSSGFELRGSPFPLTVRAAPVDAPSCVVDAPTEAEAGVWSVGWAEGKDAQGNAVTPAALLDGLHIAYAAEGAGAGDCRVALHAEAMALADAQRIPHRPSAACFAFYSTGSGAHALSVKHGGEWCGAASGEPMRVEVAAGPTCADRCTIEWLETPSLRADETGRAVLTARDRWGNPRASGGDAVHLILRGLAPTEATRYGVCRVPRIALYEPIGMPAPVGGSRAVLPLHTATCSDLGDGRYELGLAPKLVGSYYASASANGHNVPIQPGTPMHPDGLWLELLPGAISRVEIRPPPLHMSMRAASGSFALLPLSHRAIIEVLALDQHGNRCPLAADALEVRLAPRSQVSVSHFGGRVLELVPATEGAAGGASVVIEGTEAAGEYVLRAAIRGAAAAQCDAAEGTEQLPSADLRLEIYDGENSKARRREQRDLASSILGNLGAGAVAAAAADEVSFYEMLTPIAAVEAA